MASIVTPEQTQTTTIRVLAIEGDIAPAARVRSVLTNTFERLRLTECETVDTALRELTAGKADCILLGATAEDPEALAALSRLRAAGIETPVIILATKTDRSSVDRALGAGAQDLLLKGQFDERLLGRCIEYAMERRWVEFELAHQALHDGLTGLPNRALFTDRLGSALAHLEPGRRLAVLLLDIDRFRVINDSLGHDLGDRLLLMVAERISAALTDGQRAARFGGDEFAVLCEALTDHAGAVAAAERIERAFATPLLLGEEAVFLRMSTGIVLAGTDTDTDAVLRDADAAMNRAKERGGGTHEVFERPLHQHAVQRLKIEHSLHTALLREELTLSYQPQ
ncbi:MAG TPA: diguanylate cyclase response regulator, partial [Baekduia sp.]|nr:diguanylate cyclase response regulator [Baekduia sp.]